MRLKPEQIQMLARVAYDALAAEDAVEMKSSRDTVLHQIEEVIREDLKAEEDLEAEARRLLDQHRDQIKVRGGNYDEMVRMTVKRLARERKMVL